MASLMISVVQTFSVNQASSTFGTVSFANPVTAGNTVIVICIGLFTAHPVMSGPLFNGAAPVGAYPIWTQGGFPEVYDPNGGYTVGWVFPNCPAGNGVTFSTTHINIIGGTVMYEVAGLGASPFVDVSNQTTAGAGGPTAVTSGSIGPTSQPTCFVLGVGSLLGQSSAGAPGFTSTSPAVPAYCWAGYQIPVSPGGFYTWTQTANSSSSWSSTIAAIAPAPPQAQLPPVPVDYSNPNTLLPALYSYPELASKAAWSAAQQAFAPITDITVQLYDKFYKLGPTVTNYVSLEMEKNRNDTGTATVVLQVPNPSSPPSQVAWAMNCTTQVVPITIQYGANVRFSGRVNSFALALEADSQTYTCTLQCVDDYSWLSRILVWPNPALPIQVQFPSYAVFIGPAVLCALTMVAENALRLQTGAWEAIDDLISGDLNWEAWQGAWLESNGNPQEMLQVPLVVEMINPQFDTSPWIAITGRMDKISQLLKDTLMDYGLEMECNLWLPGDPQPAETTVTPLIGNLVQPCIVVSCQDRSGVVGPTGTFIDGLIESTVNLEASLLGQSLSPFLNPNNQYYPANLAINIAPALGVNFIPPWAIFNGDVKNNGLLDFKLSGYHPIAYTVVGGGKSPQWLNSLINSTLEFLIDAIEITVGFTGVPDTLLDGSFDDILLAFQMIQNFERWQQLGPYGYPEYITQTGASAYSLDEWWALMQGMFDTQGYTVVQLSFQNGYPYAMGRDVFLGSLVSFVLNGQMYTDYVYSIKLTDDRKTRAKCEVIVGDGKREVNPILRTVRMITGLEEVVNVLMLSTGSS